MFFSEKNLCLDCFIETLDDEERKAYDMGRLYISEGDDGYCDRCGGYEAIVDDFSFSMSDEDEDEDYEEDYEEDYDEEDYDEEDYEEEDYDEEDYDEEDYDEESDYNFLENRNENDDWIG